MRRSTPDCIESVETRRPQSRRIRDSRGSGDGRNEGMRTRETSFLSISEFGKIFIEVKTFEPGLHIKKERDYLCKNKQVPTLLNLMIVLLTSDTDQLHVLWRLPGLDSLRL